jgi:hypothetical protein
MLEAGNVLRTWALEQEPSPGKPISAEALPDHRLEYLTYEGAVGQVRGVVTRWAAGEYRTLEESPRCWRVLLDSPEIQGLVVLETVDPKSDESGGTQRWIWSWSS